MRISRVAASVGFLALLSGGLLGNAAQSSPAPHRAVARKGPVELRLELKETHVKVGGRLRFRLGLKNIGRSPIKLSDAVFRHVEALEENLRYKNDIFLEAVDAEGQPLFAKPLPIGSDLCIVVLSTTEAAAQAAKEASDEYALFGDDPYDRLHLEVLPPGKALFTPPWELPIHKDCKVQARTSRDGYADLWQFDFESRGNFKIRAIYDRLPVDWPTKKRKYAPSPEQIRLETPWVEVVAQ